MAKFYGIGTGPGDSSLVTVKAVNTKEINTLYKGISSGEKHLIFRDHKN